MVNGKPDKYDVMFQTLLGSSRPLFCGSCLRLIFRHLRLKNSLRKVEYPATTDSALLLKDVTSIAFLLSKNGFLKVLSVLKFIKNDRRAGGSFFLQ